MVVSSFGLPADIAGLCHVLTLRLPEPAVRVSCCQVLHTNHLAIIRV